MKRAMRTPSNAIAVAFALVLAACASSAPPVEGETAAPVSATAAPQASVAPSAVPSSVASAKPATPVDVPAEIKAMVDAPDRLPDDRPLDAGRKPGELLAFMHVQPGMHVAELGAAGGYTTEFLARAVGATGKVYGQNNKFILDKFAQKPWSERLKRPVMANVFRADRDFEDPLPPDAKNLDLVLVNLFYHDLYWLKVDRAKMNKAVLASLRPGGIYAVVDHASKAGAGATEVESLHRIEESELVRDVEAAGFKLDRSGDFLRNPADTKDWSTSPKSAAEKRGTSDRFVLLFKKPG